MHRLSSFFAGRLHQGVHSTAHSVVPISIANCSEDAGTRTPSPGPSPAKQWRGKSYGGAGPWGMATRQPVCNMLLGTSRHASPEPRGRVDARRELPLWSSPRFCGGLQGISVPTALKCSIRQNRVYESATYLPTGTRRTSLSPLVQITTIHLDGDSMECEPRLLVNAGAHREDPAVRPAIT
jgi:hypothetical protein